MSERVYTITEPKGVKAAERLLRLMFDQMLRAQVNSSQQWQTNANEARDAMLKAIIACDGNTGSLYEAFNNAIYGFGEDLRKDKTARDLLPAVGYLLETAAEQGGMGNHMTSNRAERHFDRLIDNIVEMRRHAEDINEDVLQGRRLHWDGEGGTKLSPRDCRRIPLEVPFGMKQVIVPEAPHTPPKSRARRFGVVH